MELLGGYDDDEVEESVVENTQSKSHFGEESSGPAGSLDNIERVVVSDDSDDEEDSERHGAPSSSSSSHQQSQSSGSAVDSYVKKMKVPIANQIDLGGHSKAVTCFSFEPSGNRVVTGSLDYEVKLFDFGGMDSRHRSFKTMEPQEGHMVVSISHSPSGDRFLVATGSAQPIVYDRDGTEIIKFVKGDMYLKDLSNTKGHTMEVTCVQWHPTDKNTVITSSLDGSLRIWDLLGEATFGCLINRHVLKVRGQTGQQRVGVTCCCFAPNGQRIVGGASDGSIHVWNQRKAYSKADFVLKMDGFTKAVQSVTIAKDNNTLAARYDGGTVALWNINRSKQPLKVLSNLQNEYPSANVEFSPDDSLICLATSPTTGEPDAKSRLYFFEVSSNVTEPSMSIAIAAGLSGIMVKWQNATNQLMCSLSTGAVRVYYDPLLSKKGALLSSSKAPKREKDPSDFAVVGEIYNPDALPMYKVDQDKGLKRRMELKDPVRAKIPHKPVPSGPGATENTSFFFTNYVMSGRKVDTSRQEDPRESLLKVASEAQANPMFMGKAYQSTQPGSQLHHITYEQEAEEFKKKQRQALN